MDDMTTPDATEIERYLSILEGNVKEDIEKSNESVIDLGISLCGAKVGKRYLYEYGTRWLKIIEDKNDHWGVVHGFVGHDPDDKTYIEKSRISDMIQEMYLEPIDEEEKTLVESQNNNQLDEYIEKVDRYLLLNYDIDSSMMNEDWKSLMKEGYAPNEAAELAMLKEE